MKTFDELLSTHKICRACKEYKLFDSFHKNKSTKDGLHSDCKECNRGAINERNKAIRSDPDLYEKFKEMDLVSYLKKRKNQRHLDKVKQYNDSKIRTTEQNKKNNLREMELHPGRSKVRQLTRNAIRDGRLIRLPCEICGETKVDAHHDDYDKPLDVRFLCRKHHLELHRKHKY